MNESAVEKKEDYGRDKAGIVKRWLVELKLWEKREKGWHERADKVLKRYRDEQDDTIAKQKRVNLLWSNVETRKPLLYANTPKPTVDRRFKDKDPVAMAAGKILERAVEYSLDAYDFDGLARSCVEDFLLPGRATARVVYKPVYGDPVKDPETQQAKLDEAGQPIKEVAYESAECEYVFWKDFAAGPARRWGEVPWVGFRSYLSRDQLVERFGELGHKVKLDYTPDGIKDDDGQIESFKKAQVWEFWSKADNKVYFIAPSHKDEPLEVTDPPLKLRKFFPCAKPIQAVKTNDKMCPIPEFAQYQDQADEIDKLTNRIDILTDSLKVVGVYAGKSDALERIFTEGLDNKLVPVEDWAAVAGAGGIDGLISWVPIEQVVKVLKELYVAREQLKQNLYEVTGLSDIIRGASDPDETAAAQKIKGRFAGMRLEDKQKEVAEFLRDLIELKAEVIAEEFSPKTLQLMTGIRLPSLQEKQAALQAGQNLQQPSWDEVIQLLRNDPIRTFRIDIETDSTIQIDEQAEKEARTEFLEAATGFMERAAGIAQVNPGLMPLLTEMLMFGVRGFRAGRDLENAFEEAIQQVKQQAAEPAPDPEAEKQERELQMKERAAELDAKIKEREAMMDMQIKEREAQQSAQLEAFKAEQKSAIEQRSADMKAEIMQLQASQKAQSDMMSMAMKQRQSEQQFSIKEMTSLVAGLDKLLAAAKKDGEVLEGNVAKKLDQVAEIVSGLVGEVSAMKNRKDHDVEIDDNGMIVAVDGRKVNRRKYKSLQ